MAKSEYKAVWLFAMFDLPVETKNEKRQYVRFRKKLLQEGFTMLQYSVYARYCNNEEASDVYRNRLMKLLPSDGQVRLLSVTDKQFAKQVIFVGKKRQKPDPPLSQLLLF